MRNGTELVIDFIQNFNLDIADASIKQQGLRCLLDSLGAMLAGSDTPVAKLTAKLAEEQMPGRCALFASDKTASALGAAFANGFASNALDVEHGYRLTQGRPGGCILPVLFALAQISAQPVAGRAFLEALIVGYEVAIRAGLLRNTDPLNVFTSGAWASFGAVAAGARILRLDKKQMAEAFGLVDYHGPAGLIMHGVETPCMAKDGIGWGAFAAMAALLMARANFTAPKSIFSYAADRSCLEDLGENWHFFNLYFKPYCSCRWTHAAVDGALKIKKQRHLKPENISKILIKTFHHAAALPKEIPSDTEHAQYNIAYPVAVALLDDVIGSRQIMPPRLADEDAAALMRRIEVMVDDQFNAAFPAKTISEVIIEANGESFSSGPLEPRWEASAPPTDAELKEKFRILVSQKFGAKEITRLLKAVETIENQPDCLILLPKN